MVVTCVPSLGVSRVLVVVLVGTGDPCWRTGPAILQLCGDTDTGHTNSYSFPPRHCKSTLRRR